MKNHSDENWNSLRRKIIGLGDRSTKKSFYPQLQKNISELERFRYLLDKINDGIVLINLSDYLIEDINSSALSILQLNKTETLFKDSRKVFNKLGLNKFIDTLNRTSNPSINLKTQSNIIRNNKKLYLDFIINIETFSNTNYAVVLLRDVTERVNAEKELLQSKSHLHTIFESIRNSVWSIDKDFKLLAFNNSFAGSFEILTNKKPEIGTNILDYWPEEGAKIWKKRYLRALKPETYSFEEKFVLEGKTFINEFLLTPLIIRNKPDGVVVVQHDITQRKLAEIEVKESEQRFRSMIEFSPIGAAILRNNKIIYINQALLEIFKVENSKEVTGKSIYRFIDKDYIYILKSAAKLQKDNIEFKSRREAVGITNGGEKINITIDASPIHIMDGTAIVVFIVNTTQQKEFQRSLQKAKEEAEKSEMLKTEFLAQMSHEIRTPINTILSFISLIKSDIENVVDEETLNSFSIINNASARIIRTIDLLLNMSEIQTGNYTPEFKTLNLYHDVLINVISEFTPIAKQKGLELRINNMCTYCDLNIDEYTVTQIFINLIENAIKYTKAGFVEVNISSLSYSKIIVEVKDTGIGILKKYQKSLFIPFTQEESGYTRSYEGNGLGLALVKEYCEINNASIKVISTKNKGSSFFVEFKKV